VYKGLLVTVCSHGIGALGAAIAFEELIAAGARTIIRVGTCGGLQLNINAGDLVIATAAVQNTGYGNENLPPGYPASADYEVINALKQATMYGGVTASTGLILTRDVFYASEAAPTHKSDYHLQLSRARVLAVEMECAALFQIGNLHGVRTGALLAVDGNVLKSSESFET
jgi:uridine phosphorylase